MKIFSYLCIFLCVAALDMSAQTTRHVDVYVDTNGVLRWKGTDDEVSLFGVNYTTPFAYSYRAHKRLGLSLKKAIDLDVAHLARLDLDAFRVHVWDREVSDTGGNLLANEHLDLMDYLLARLAEHGFKTILTPIAWWGTGWPEPDEMTKGFSQKYSKLELITNPTARAAERNYLKQFVAHRNPYRKMSYRDDPSIIAFEIINEPSHPDDKNATTDYINEMADVLRKAGVTKPLFYNISQNWSPMQANAVAKANIDGVSFQWYPTDLVHNKMLVGNYLVNVNSYPIPSDSIEGYNRKAKMVYEFDAADVGGSYMYPAMVRSFRESGMQFAAMFSYDPVQIAWSNTEYPTHFVNLLYTPSKAISLMIAAKAFHQLPRLKSYGTYPENNSFGDVRVSYDENLSELNSPSEFVYSNTNKSVPKNASSLMHVAGCGSSSVVTYDGTGAYFLDKLEEGVWRLEVYPDVLWLRDPFEITSVSRQVARLFLNRRSIAIHLPDLGKDHRLRALSKTKEFVQGVAGYSVRPGRYLLTARRIDGKTTKKYQSQQGPFLEGLYTPPPISSGIYVVNKSPQTAIESTLPAFRFEIASDKPISGAALYIRRPGWRGFARHPLANIGGFMYVLADTPGIIQSGRIEYCVMVEAGDTLTFPDGVRNAPGKWDFSADNLWEMKVVQPGSDIVVFDPSRDTKDIVVPHFSRTMRYTIDERNVSPRGDAALTVSVVGSMESTSPFAFQLGVAQRLKPFVGVLQDYHHVAFHARSLQDSVTTLGVILIMSNGSSYGADVGVDHNWRERKISLSAFRTRVAKILPDAFPHFLPKLWRTEGGDEKPDLRYLMGIQIVVDSAGAGVNQNKKFSFEISSVRLVEE